MVTFIGTKNEPVTSVTIILPSFGRFCIKRPRQQPEDVRRPINEPDKHHDDGKAGADDAVAQFNEVGNEGLFDVPSSWVCWGSLTPALG